MSRERQRHVALLHVLKMVSEKDLAELSRAQNEVQFARKQLGEIHAALRERTIQISAISGNDMAFLQGHDTLWVELQQLSIRERSIELANVAARAEAQKKSAGKSFGRFRAMESLLGQKEN